MDVVNHQKANDFAVEMARIQNDCEGDPEDAHWKMDDLMCKTLRELGYGAGVDVFDLQDKWYA